jgi:hypothetical protein
MNMLSRLGAVALAAPVVLAPNAIGETLRGGSKPSEMMPLVIQIPDPSPSSRNPSLSRNNAANGSRPDAVSVAQVSREVAQGDANKQKPTNSQPQREEQRTLPENYRIGAEEIEKSQREIDKNNQIIKKDNQESADQLQQNSDRFQEFLRNRQQSK